MLLQTSTEYRSAIFYHSPEQLETAKQVTEEVQKKHFDPIGAFRTKVSRHGKDELIAERDCRQEDRDADCPSRSILRR